MGFHRRATVSRRHFLRQSVMGAGALTLGGSALANALQINTALPAPSASGIDHIVILMMENRSFDHFLGWMKGVDGQQAGLSYADADGVLHPTHRLTPDFQGCGHPDPDHSYEGARVEFDAGACDGWLRAGQNDEYAIGYYTDADLPFLAQAARDWTTCDRYFAAIMSSTYPNRFYMHAAQTDRLDNSLALSTLPTIWDRLAVAGLQGRYYYSDVPFLAFWGAQYLPIARPFEAFLTDCQAGTLPEVSVVDPHFLGEAEGLSTDDHPHADIRNGEAFINAVYQAVVSSPAWPNTLLIVTYDEWGGFFDHVAPPLAPIPTIDATLGSDGRLGFRVPTLLISPLGTKKTITSQTFDHTSILRMIEWRWNLPPLTVRDETATNLAEAFTFGKTKLHAPAYRVPATTIPTACVTGAALVDNEWFGLMSVARQWGWSVG